jgi:hypothetical protein
MKISTPATKPKKPREKLTKNIVFRVSPTQYTAYREAALAANQGLADWIRSQLPDPSPPTKRPSPGTAKHKVRVPADPALLRQLAAMGNNLNQIARAINRGQLGEASPVERTRLLLVLGKIKNLLGELRNRHIEVNKNVD